MKWLTKWETNYQEQQNFNPFHHNVSAFWCQTLCQVLGIQRCIEQSLPSIGLCATKQPDRQMPATQCANCHNKDNVNKADGIIKSSRGEAQGGIRKGFGEDGA